MVMPLPKGILQPMEHGRSLHVLHSVLDPRSIAEFVEDQYPFGTVDSCTLIRSFVNEVYRLQMHDGGAYIFKVYRQDWRNEPDVAWEVHVQRHLMASGIVVSEPLPLRDASYVVGLDTPEGRRAGVLLARLAGNKPVHPFTDDLYFRHGESLAAFHTALDVFPLAENARNFDASFLIDRSAGIILDSPGTSLSDLHRATLRKVADKLQDRLQAYDPRADWGICHGDATMDNVHVLPDGRHAFFDFDLAGHSWRVLDLSTIYLWARREDRARTFWPAFLDGYRSRRDFSESDVALLPVMAAAWEMWDIGHELERWRRWSGSWHMTAAQLHERIELLGYWDD